MTAAIDTGLEFFRQTLALRGYRQQILSADIANASTPGFKAVDLDFGRALAVATGGGSAPPPQVWLVDDARQFAAPAGAAPTAAAAAVKYQADTSETLDGNSVNLNQEKAAAAENAVQYEAAATFTAQLLKMLGTAIGGAGAQGVGG